MDATSSKQLTKYPRTRTDNVTLDPGAYTALVSGANNTSGVALVEVYATP